MKIKYIMGNIADMSTDAIVLPANRWLKEGSGSSRAIFERAGRKKLNAACEEIIKERGTLDITDAYPTLGFDTNASVIIHAVVPKWIDGHSDEYANLLLTYRNSLAVADELGCNTIAFPLLAAGNNGFDLSLALEIAQTVITEYSPQNKLDEVNLVLYDQKAINLVKNQGKKLEIENEVKKAPIGFFKKQKGVNIKKEDILKNAKFAFDVYSTVKKFCTDNPEVIETAKKTVVYLMKK